MNKLKLSLMLLIFVTTQTSAQSWVDNLKNQQKTTAVTDPQAKKILDKVSAKYKTYKSIVAVFKLKIENTKNKLSEEQSGKVFLSGLKYKLEMKSQDIICDNKTVWTYIKDSKEVQVNTFESGNQSISPSQIFTIYEKGFAYVYAGEEKEKTGNILDIIDLTPTDKTKSVFKIKLLIDRNLSQIKKAVVLEKNGNKYTYSLSSFDTKQLLNDNFFTWKASENPGISLIDLR
jgi:outer membrane lipoprotein-sorting protein